MRVRIHILASVHYFINLITAVSYTIHIAYCTLTKSSTKEWSLVCVIHTSIKTSKIRFVFALFLIQIMNKRFRSFLHYLWWSSSLTAKFWMVLLVWFFFFLITVDFFCRMCLNLHLLIAITVSIHSEEFSAEHIDAKSTEKNEKNLKWKREWKDNETSTKKIDQLRCSIGSSLFASVKFYSIFHHWAAFYSSVSTHKPKRNMKKEKNKA